MCRKDRVSTLTNKICECGGVYQLFEYNIGNNYSLKRFVCLKCRDEKTFKSEVNDGRCSKENR